MQEHKKTTIRAGAEEIHDERAFGTDDIEFEIPDLTSNVHGTVNQDKHPDTINACTIFGPVNQLIRLFGLKLSEEEANKLARKAVDYCTTQGYVKGQGWFTALGTLHTVERWNKEGRKEFDKEEVFYVRPTWGDKRIKEALNKGHYVGMTYNASRSEDSRDGVVDQEEHTKFGGHRTNLRDPHGMLSSAGTLNNGYEVAVHDNYEGYFNKYFIDKVEKRLHKEIFPEMYLILPKSCIGKKTVEEAKKQIKENKAVNAILGILSSTYASLPHQQDALAKLAKSLRTEYPYARELVEDEQKKVMQAVVDVLSFAYKFAEPRYQAEFARIAGEMRKRYGLK